MANHNFLRASDFDIPFILLAEDDDNDAFGMELAFQKVGLGKRFWRVCDGNEVVDYIEGNGDYRDRLQYPMPSLLLLDLKMAGKDGFEVLRWLRSHSRWKSLIAVVLTDSEHRGDVTKAYELGANSYLVKPTDFLSFTNMLKLLERYWSLNQAPRALRRPERAAS